MFDNEGGFDKISKTDIVQCRTFIQSLIHEADPQSRPGVITNFARLKSRKAKQFSSENSDSRTVGPAEWIIDGTQILFYLNSMNLKLLFWKNI